MQFYLILFHIFIKKIDAEIKTPLQISKGDFFTHQRKYLNYLSAIAACAAASLAIGTRKGEQET